MAIILGIETSCDETAAAVVRDGREILSNVVASQVPLHARFHGVVPELASRAHVEEILPVIVRSLEEASVSPDRLDAIAVVHRPGLIGALLVGVSAAKALSWALGKPLIAVNHLEAHVYGGIMENEDVTVPLVALVASGGHTSLFYVRDILEMERVGRTTDDAAGEAFDKVAALLGLGYPGGPAIERAARAGKPDAFAFPRAQVAEYDFSFSGIKTASLYLLRGLKGGRTPEGLQRTPSTPDVAASFQEAVVDMIVETTMKLAREREVRDVVIGGGVACNARLREKLGAALRRDGRRLVAPAAGLCTDNAAVVAGLGWHLWRAGRLSGLDLDGEARDVPADKPDPQGEGQER
ncbi:MAG: tRNA (adenosine(37)-N6)-threonylcarbamoyltransferase complex transferase subunit TsaD [Planctomycetota bacterium]